jgi:UDP-hydrolysing UDP-N-acetyl-D-glucosamine 2-epimerase
MASKRKICVVTGGRAEYGLLYWLMKEIAADNDLQLQVIATGMHLAPEFGLTFRQIEADGFTIDAKVEMLDPSDTSLGVAKSMGRGVIGIAEALDRLKPDILVMLGDRFEILAAAQAAMVLRIPIAHIHGGEVTEGAFDEAFRHAITKMAQWHFVAAEPYRKRVVQLGEPPDRVFNFGAPGLDQLATLRWMARAELEATLGIGLGSPLFLVTYHPVTLKDESPVAAMRELLAALDDFTEATVILTYPNADTGGRALIACVDAWVAQRTGRAKAFASLGQRVYLSLMREADLVLGNSSSGLTEAPALKKASINLGDRQKGRLRAASVIDAAERKADIVASIGKALSDEFRSKLAGTVSLYGSGKTSSRIKDVLKSARPVLQKPFLDIAHGY